MLLHCDDSVCVASGRRPDGTQGPWRWYEFTTSGTPTGGTCTITPTDGEYLLTRFTIICNGYSDPHGVQYADFYVDRSNRRRVTAVNTRLTIDHTLTYQIFFYLAEHVGHVLVEIVRVSTS